MAITHVFVNEKADETPGGRVRPSNWNEDHVQAFEGAKVWRYHDQATATGAETLVEWTTTVFDSGGYVDLGAQPTRLTIPQDGIYLVQAQVTWTDEDFDGIRFAYFAPNLGTLDDFYPETLIPVAVGDATIQTLSGLLALQAEDWMYLIAKQSSGSSVNVGGWASVTRLGDIP